MISNFPIQLPYILNVKKACSVLTSWVRWSGGILSFAKPSCSIITWCWVCMNINFYWQGKMCHLVVKVILAVSMVFILFWFTKKQIYFPGKKGWMERLRVSPFLQVEFFSLSNKDNNNLLWEDETLNSFFFPKIYLHLRTKALPALIITNSAWCMIVLDLPLLLIMVGSDLVAGYRLGDTEGDSSQPLPETLSFRADAPQQPVRHHQQTCIYKFTNQCGTCTDNHLSIMYTYS